MIYLRSISKFNYFFAFFFFSLPDNNPLLEWQSSMQLPDKMPNAISTNGQTPWEKNDETITGVQLQWICKVSAEKERRVNVILRSDLCKKVTTVVYFVCLFASVLLFLSFFRHTFFFLEDTPRHPAVPVLVFRFPCSCFASPFHYPGMQRNT